MRKRWFVISVIVSLCAGVILGLSVPHLLRKDVASHFTPNHFLANYLSLSDSQRKKVESLNRAFYPKIMRMRAQLAEKRAELSELLEEAPLNQEKIEVKINEIAHLQAQLEKEVLNHIGEVGQILTPAQRKRFFSFVRERLRRREKGWGRDGGRRF